jgi:hypothetical protein
MLLLPPFDIELEKRRQPWWNAIKAEFPFEARLHRLRADLDGLVSQEFGPCQFQQFHMPAGDTGSRFIMPYRALRNPLKARWAFYIRYRFRTLADATYAQMQWGT